MIPTTILNTWQALVASYNNNDQQAVANLTIVLSRQLLNFADVDVSKIEPAIDLIQWMRCCYQIKHYTTIASQPVISYNFTDLIPAFKRIAGEAELEQNIVVLLTILKIEIDNIFMLVNQAQIKPSVIEVEPCFARLAWALSNLRRFEHISEVAATLRQIKIIFAQHEINDLTFWQLGYDANRIEQLIILLMSFDVLMLAEETKILNKKCDEYNCMLPAEIFQRLCDRPAALLSYATTNPYLDLNYKKSKEAFFNQEKYLGLSECHCCKEFTRGADNIRDISEQYLLQYASKYNGTSFKIGIIGSGGLFQTVVLLAKISNQVKFINLYLDLVDPVMFDQKFDCQDIAKSFVQLLVDLGFNITLMPVLAKLCTEIKISSENNRGNIILEIYDNYEFRSLYTQAADIVFINDCPVSPSEKERILSATPPEAYCISAATVTDFRVEQKMLSFSVKAKIPPNNNWTEVTRRYVPTIHQSPGSTMCRAP